MKAPYLHHGRMAAELTVNEPLTETPLRRATQQTGWYVANYDDPPQRFLAIATRQ